MLAQADSALRSGDPSRADAIAGQVVRTDARAHPAWFLLAQTRHALGDPKGALDAMRRASSLSPGNPSYRFNLAMLLRTHGRREEAHRELAALVEGAPEDARRLAELGNALIDINEFDLALRCQERRMALAPDDPQALLAVVRVWYRRRDWDRCRAMLDEGVERFPSSAAVFSVRARLNERTNRLDEAQRDATRAVELDPRDPMAHLELGKLHRRRGSPQAAVDCLDRAKELGPSGKTGIDTLVELGFALDELGRHDEAFDRMTEAQGLWSSGPRARQYPRSIYPARLRALGGVDWSSEVGSWTGSHRSDHPAPVFFVGFPRSGTTLAERILGAHPGLIPTDEPPFLNEVIKRLAERVGSRDAIPRALGSLDPGVLGELEGFYFEQAQQALGREAVSQGRILDKMPLNIVELPFVRRLFPDAKVIVALRDPRDCCLSCFFQHFNPNVALVHSDTLDNTAELYAQVMGLWLRYREELGQDWLEYRYEDLVSQGREGVDAWARRVLGFLGLEFDPRVLEPAQDSASSSVKTPSYSSIVNPVNDRAVGRWKRYRGRFDRAERILEPFIEAFGYADADSDAPAPGVSHDGAQETGPHP